MMFWGAFQGDLASWLYEGAIVGCTSVDRSELRMAAAPELCCARALQVVSEKSLWRCHCLFYRGLAGGR